MNRNIKVKRKIALKSGGIKSIAITQSMIEKNISQLNIMIVVFNVKEFNRNSEIILLKMIQNRIKIKNKKKVQQEYTMLTAKGINTNTMDIINN